MSLLERPLTGPTTDDPGPHPRSADPSVIAAPAAAIFFLGALGGIQAVDPTIASTALVEAARGLSMQGRLLAFAASISTLMLAATVVSAGLLGARTGWRRMLSCALVVAIAGDVIVAAAPSSTVYLLGRAIAGVGLGGVFTASFAYIRIITPSDRMPKALGLYAASGSVVLVLLSVTGGFVASANWRLAFLLIPAACALCLLATRFVLPVAPPSASGPADVPGQILLMFGIMTLLVGVSHMSRGLTNPWCWAPLTVGAVLLGWFAVFEQRTAHPCFPIPVLRSAVFLAAVCAGFIYNFAQSSTVLQFANLWQYVNGLAPSQVSLGLLPFMLIGIVAALVAGRLIGQAISEGTAIAIGGAFVAAGGLATLLLDPTSHQLAGLPALCLIGFGATMASIPYGGLIVRSASGRFASFYGSITSARASVGQIAYALGLAVSTVMVNSLTHGGVVHRLDRAGVPPTRTGAALDSLGVYVKSGTKPSTRLGEQALSAATASYTASFKITMVAVGGLCLLLGATAAALLRREDKRTT